MECCSICCDNYNLKNRIKKTCTYCEFEVCNKCVQTYMLGSINDPHCMSCRKAWDQELFDKMVNKSFRLNEYKKHRETILYDIEKSLMPQTQQQLQIELQKRHYKEVNKELKNTVTNLIGFEYNKYRQLLINIRRELFENRNINDVTIYNKLIEKKYIVEKELSNICLQIRTNRKLILSNSRIIRNLRLNGSDNDSIKTKTIFTIRCPRDTCKGFISGDEWKCGVCQYFSCEKCHEIIGESKDVLHKCNIENIETVKLLKKEAKSCPGCSTLIYRVSGCSQMWCTQCHTAFSWNTGLIEKGAIHNPHFYEYQKANTNYIVRNQGEEVCGGIRVSLRKLLWFLSGNLLDDPYKNIVYTTHRNLIHIQQVEMPRFNVQFFVNTNLNLRIKYLLNEISEKDFKRKLQIIEKSKNKKREIFLIIEMYVQTTHDMFRNLVDTPFTDVEEQNKIIKDWVEQIHTLQEYSNQHFEKISKLYKCVTPCISSTGGFQMKHYH